MAVARWLQKGFSLFFSWVIWKPLAWISRGAFRVALLPLYSWYTKIKQRIRNSPNFSGIRSLGHFFERYALYAALVALGVFGLSNNLFAQTIRPDEVGRGAIWTTFVQDEGSDLIVETGLTQAPTVASASTLAVGGPVLTATDEDAAVNFSQVESAPGTDVPITDTVVGVTGASSVTSDRRGTEHYVVEGGDTVSTIAEQFGVSSRTILWANGLSDSDFIKPGQQLKIPSVSGYLYAVKSGDTVASIAQKYKGNEQQILEANSLPLADALQSGSEIIIPGGEPPAPVAVAQPRNLFQQVFTRGDNPPANAPTSRARFLWPTPNHRINQYYRGRYHTGIDIEGTYSSPIYASSGGTVEFASSDRSGYGLHVIINHGNGLRTLYGHASKIFVSVGQHVNQGQTIAMVGSTGRSTGTHLHFEIRIGGSPLNPLAYF